MDEHRKVTVTMTTAQAQMLLHRAIELRELCAYPHRKPTSDRLTLHKEDAVAWESLVHAAAAALRAR